MHLRTARDLAQDFKQKRYLCAEVNVKSGGVSHRKKTPAVVVIEKLLKAIQRMEVEVENEIRKLDEQTKGMIELVRWSVTDCTKAADINGQEFNLVSIYEARTSKIMGMSMKRLSWITVRMVSLQVNIPLLIGAVVHILAADVRRGNVPNLQSHPCYR